MCPHCGLVGGTQTENPLNATPETRHQMLLNSNEAPLDSDAPLIHSALSKTNARLAFLDQEIARLQEERASLTSYRTRNRGILSPLRKMPPEVLGEIFLLAVPTMKARRKVCVTDSPWYLTHVSGHWRAVAVSIPALWSFIHVHCVGIGPLYPSAMLETQIARAARMKIHFHGTEWYNSQTQVGIFQRLAKHCSRWEELDLTLTSAILPLFASLRGRLPLLRRVWIQWAEEESQNSLTLMDVFDGALSLVDVGIYSQYRFLPFSLPVQQLTHYDLDAPWRTHQAILKMSPKLVEARIAIGFGPEFWPPEEEVIELPCLQRLYASRPEILDYIRVPALEDLALHRLIPYRRQKRSLLHYTLRMCPATTLSHLPS
ncbi:hypothetical protein DFH06DRAFT_518744 [Mycena polygramma]|nr:hypothetical protein DFH06DRAFT_518744 [Mycena polygramma]